jgi:hypothetical protein
MTGEAAADPARTAGTTGAHVSADYAGAVYGSLLAASVIVGASPHQVAPQPLALIVLLLATGIVFWLAHAYAQLFGDRMHGAALTFGEVRAVAAREWPIVEAAVPPATAAAIAAIAGLPDSTVAWIALITAIAGQLGWAIYAAARAGASRWVIAISGLANLVLGLLLVVLKVVVSH